MGKYLVELDGDQWIATDDDPDYDGPVSNVNDDIYTYHVDADTPEEAIDIAEQEYFIDTDGDFDVSEA
jgi:hypothetical protein